MLVLWVESEIIPLGFCIWIPSTPRFGAGLPDLQEVGPKGRDESEPSRTEGSGSSHHIPSTVGSLGHAFLAGHAGLLLMWLHHSPSPCSCQTLGLRGKVTNVTSEDWFACWGREEVSSHRAAGRETLPWLHVRHRIGHGCYPVSAHNPTGAVPPILPM